jgi:hypothetical protein
LIHHIADEVRQVILRQPFPRTRAYSGDVGK